MAALRQSRIVLQFQLFAACKPRRPCLTFFSCNGVFCYIGSN